MTDPRQPCSVRMFEGAYVKERLIMLTNSEQHSMDGSVGE